MLAFNNNTHTNTRWLCGCVFFLKLNADPVNKCLKIFETKNLFRVNVEYSEIFAFFVDDINHLYCLFVSFNSEYIV